MNISRRLGWLFALTATLAYSANAPLARSVILEGMNPTTLLTARFILGSLLFGGTIMFTPLGRTSADQRPLDQRGFWVAIGSGVANGLMLLCFYWALTRINASLSSPLSIALIPIFTFAILRFGGERLTQRHYVRLLLSLLGIYFLLGFSGRIDLIGVVLVVLGAFLFAAHIVSVQWYLQAYNTWVVSALMVGAATIIIVALWLVDVRTFFVPGVFGWVVIIILGIVASYLGRVLTYMAINVLGSAQMALLSPLETVLTIFWSVLFLSETLLPLQWLGALLIVGSLLLAAERRPKQAPQTA